MSSFEHLLIGRQVVGRYQVTSVLGRGGMGAVFRAHDHQLQRDVALKVIAVPPGTAAATMERLRTRFHREARTAAAIAHPNVAAIFDFGRDETLEFDYIVMELLHGQSLESWMEERGPASPEVALQILSQAAEGLAAGHALGIVHRDIKPSNLFLSPTLHGFRVRLLDFGIATPAQTAQTATRLTEFGPSPHTRGYAAPEQVSVIGVTSPASDVYSLGVTGLSVLAGGLPNRLDVPATLPASLAEVLCRCLRDNPGERYSDAGALSQALQRVCSLSEKSSPQSDPSSTRPATPVPLASPASTVATGRRRSWIIAATSTIALLTTGLFWTKLIRSTDDSGEVATVLDTTGSTGEIAFGGITWGEPIPTAYARLKKAGLTPLSDSTAVSEDSSSGPGFLAPDSSNVELRIDANRRVIGVSRYSKPGPTASSLAWFERQRDSLTREFGAPKIDTVSGTRTPTHSWQHKGSEINLSHLDFGAHGLALLHWASPKFALELNRSREDASEEPRETGTQAVVAARELYQSVNARAGKMTRRYHYEDERGSALVAYVSGDTVYKIVERRSDGAIQEFYLDSGQLRFVYLAIDQSTRRSYFANDGRLVRVQNLDGSITSYDDGANTELERLSRQISEAWIPRMQRISAKVPTWTTARCAQCDSLP